MRLGLPVIALLLLGFPTISAQSEQKLRPEPVKGVVYRGVALACGVEPNTTLTVRMAPLAGGGPGRRVFCGAGSAGLVRWHVGFGHFWPLSCSQEFGEWDRAEAIYRFDLPALLEGKRATPEGVFADGLPAACFTGCAPLLEPVALALHVRYAPRLYYDFLPVAEDRVRLFVLTNIRGRLEPLGKSGEAAAARIDVDEDQAAAPRWSMEVYETRTRWDAKAREWRGDEWSRVESVGVGFHEPFQMLARGEGYYFVTASGKLFAAPKVPKGQARVMRPVWADPRQPVVAFVTDADAGWTWLFCAGEPEEAKVAPAQKAVYFELSEEPRPLRCRADDLPKAEGDEPLRTVLRYARFLRDQGKLKAK
jgi:hypothetical protein